MRRTLDATAFNEIANDPEVRPWLGGIGSLDLGAVVGNPDNFAFLTDGAGGGYIYIKIGLGLYAAHTLAVSAARGRPMLRAMKESLNFLFAATDALEVTTVVPDGNEAASRWADIAGFREMYRRERSFDLMSEMVGVSYRTLGYADWVMHEDSNRKAGETFHAFLVENGAEVNHPDDPAHDAWVGATFEGCVVGNIGKAIGLYNRFAATAGYQQARVLSLTPPLLDLGNAVIALVSGRVQVINRPSVARSALFFVEDERGAPSLSERQLQPPVPAS